MSASTVHRVDDLEINEDMAYQQRAWQVQRVGWLVLLLILLAALVGVFGGGPISRATSSEPSGALSVEYPRFARYKAPTEIRVQLGPNVASQDQARVWIAREYVQDHDVQAITPEPDQVEAGSDRLVYVFNINPPDQPTEITFFVQPEQVGRIAGTLGLDGGPSLSFGQWVYP